VAREALERYVAAAGAPHPRSLGAFTQNPARGARVPAKDAKGWVREQWRQRVQPSDRGDAPDRP
jgi:hypothetical protein